MHNILAKNSLSLIWVTKLIALSLYSVRLQRPRSAIKPQSRFRFSSSLRGKVLKRKFRKCSQKISIQLFCFGRGGKALCEFWPFFFVLECVAWVGCLIFLLFLFQSLLYLECILGIFILFSCGLWSLFIFTYPQ